MVRCRGRASAVVEQKRQKHAPGAHNEERPAFNWAKMYRCQLGPSYVIGHGQAPWSRHDLGQQKPIISGKDHRYRIGRVPHLGPVVTWAKWSSMSQARAIPTWSDTVTHLVSRSMTWVNRSRLSQTSRCCPVGTVMYSRPVRALGTYRQ